MKNTKHITFQVELTLNQFNSLSQGDKEKLDTEIEKLVLKQLISAIDNKVLLRDDYEDF